MAQNNEVKVIITGENKSDQAFKQAEGNVSKLNKFLSDNKAGFQAVAIAGTTAFASIALAIKSSIKEANDAEIAQKRLTTIFKANQKGSEEEAKALFDQAKALQKVGVVSEDVITIGQGTFATFDLQAKSIQKLIPSFLDMVVAEKGVNATTDDMISFANGLGQALQGNFTSLTKRGFILDDNTKEMIANGNETERITALTQVLDSTYKGMNESMRNTTAGGIKGMSLAFSEMRQEIGTALQPIIQKLTETIIPLIDKVTEWIAQNPELAGKILLVAGAVTGLISLLSALALIMPAIIAGFSLLSGPVGMVALGVAGLVLIVRNLIEIVKILHTDSKTVWEGIKVIWGEALDSIRARLQPVIDLVASLSAGLNSLWSSAKNFGGNVIGGAKIVGSSVKGLLGFDTGGVVPGPLGSPQLAMVHGGETILPTHKNSSAGMGTTINIYNPTLLDETMVSKLSDMLTRQLKRGIRV